VEKSSGCKFIGAVTDNAKNISNVFDQKSDSSLAVLFNRFILRVSCQAHTMNLVLTTLEEIFPPFATIRAEIKEYSSFLHSKKIHNYIDIDKRCPMIREQRWFTEYHALKWICINSEKLEKAHKNLPEQMEHTDFPVTAEWHLLRDSLYHLASYTFLVEADMLPLWRAYDLLAEVKGKLEEEAPHNIFSSNIIKAIEIRWSTTASEDLMKLCSFVYKFHLEKWRYNYEEVSRRACSPTHPPDFVKQVETMNREITEIIQITIEWGTELNYHFADAKEEIKYLLHYATPSHSRKADDYWIGIVNSAPNTIAKAAKEDIKLDITKVKNVAEFYQSITSLPSTEAYCERVFKNMRELFSPTRSSVKDDLKRAETLIRMHILMEKREEKNSDDDDNQDDEAQ
jgi:hypothetical protein